jgi:cysteine-rich repeat protein
MVDGDACSNACTKNVCGNGRLDTGEACDDGNKNDNDGCTNQCMIARCGNGAKEGAEECDDGNMVDDDGCSNMCTANVCGNMRIDPGEVCDGDTVGIMCASCKTKTDVCRPCEEQNCTNYMNLNLDLVAACYNNPDPSFVQKCSDAVACAREKNCAYTPRGAEQCYCGDATTSQCAAGMGINGPCKAEFEAAAGSPDYAVVTKNFGTRRLPIGSAVFMLQCDQASCADVCTPKP